MGGGAAGGLSRHQQWSSSWIIPRMRNPVKTAGNWYFFGARTFKIIHKLALCIILSSTFTFIVERCWKNMHFHSKMAWPPATYDVISRNHSSWPSLKLSQNELEGWTNSYWKRHVLMSYRLGKKFRKASEGEEWQPPLPPPLVRSKTCSLLL